MRKPPEDEVRKLAISSEILLIASPVAFASAAYPDCVNELSIKTLPLVTAAATASLRLLTEIFSVLPVALLTVSPILFKLAFQQ